MADKCEVTRSRCIKVLFVCALATVCACKSPSPWARSIPAEERAAWPTLCGIPANEISKAADGPTENFESSMYQLTRKQIVSCRLSWNREEGRLESLSVQFADSGVERLSNEQIAPYLNLVLKELRPPERREIEAIAKGSMRPFTRVGRFDARGGHDTWGGQGFWSLYVAVH